MVAELLHAGHQVSTLHRGPPLNAVRAGGGYDGGKLAGVEHIRADVLSGEARGSAERAQAVVHLAGWGDVQDSFRRPFEYNRLNALGTLNVLEGARRTGGHVVLASTQRVYRATRGPIREDAALAPADPYAVSKLVAERWCRMYSEQLGVPTTVVRLFSVYGPGQVGQGTSGVVSIFLGRALRNEPLEVHAAQRRDLTEVGDVARGIRLALERHAGSAGVPPGGEARLAPTTGPGGTPALPGRVYNLATGVGTSLEELARMICRVTGSGSTVVPPECASDEGDRVADVSLARSELGYEPTISVEAGLRRVAESFRGAA
jgi:UDP-glucose 4-epimerase